MRACVVTHHDPSNPLAAMQIRDVAPPARREGWVRIKLEAASLNMHDLWTLRGVGQDPQVLPLILGCDGAGILLDDAPDLPAGSAVITHPVIASADRGGGDETLDPQRALVSERHDGTFAEIISLPARCALPRPQHLSASEAACVPVAWGTAFRMLRRAGVRAGMSVLVQGASGGVNSAAIALARASGARVWVTSRTKTKRDFARSLGAHEVFETGGRLPERVDVVVDNVGAKTWAHSLRCAKPGGVIVTCGATTGADVNAELLRVFFHQLSIIGSTGATRSELLETIAVMENFALRPTIDSEIALSELPQAMARMEKSELIGKVVITDFIN
ncbi:MAG: zinc-binding dehydrogenase [Bowdeniella nasicola]|nr:zinc-binding dehydrogenase [Bowdeniella nasicola]